MHKNKKKQQRKRLLVSIKWLVQICFDKFKFKHFAQCDGQGHFLGFLNVFKFKCLTV